MVNSIKSAHYLCCNKLVSILSLFNVYYKYLMVKKIKNWKINYSSNNIQSFFKLKTLMFNFIFGL